MFMCYLFVLILIIFEQGLGLALMRSLDFIILVMLCHSVTQCRLIALVIFWHHPRRVPNFIRKIRGQSPCLSRCEIR